MAAVQVPRIAGSTAGSAGAVADGARVGSAVGTSVAICVGVAVAVGGTLVAQKALSEPGAAVTRIVFGQVRSALSPGLSTMAVCMAIAKMTSAAIPISG